jgi:hypothetical protein
MLYREALGSKVTFKYTPLRAPKEKRVPPSDNMITEAIQVQKQSLCITMLASDICLLAVKILKVRCLCSHRDGIFTSLNYFAQNFYVDFYSPFLL